MLREIYTDNGHVFVDKCPDQYVPNKDNYFQCDVEMCRSCDASRGFFNEDNQQVMWHTDLCGNIHRMKCVRPEPEKVEGE